MSGDDDNVNLETAASQALAEIVPRTGPLAAYLVWAQTQQPHPLYAVACALTLATHELARYGFHLRQSEYSMGLWFTLAGDSATGKSTAIKAARKFIETVWKEAQVFHPTNPWIESEGSIAGLLTVLSDLYDPNRQTTVALLFHHEFSAVLQTREPIAEMICRLADGHTYERNLRELQKGGGNKRGAKGGPERIESPAISGLFASTEPALASVFTAAHRAGGLYSRFAWINPTFSVGDIKFRRDVRVEDDPLYKSAVEQWTGWLGMIGLVDKEISLSPEAEVMLEDFCSQQTALMRENDVMNGPRLRLIEKARVFSAVFAVSDLRSVVSVADMTYACNLAEVLIEQADGLSYIGADPLVRKVKRAKDLIDGANEIGVSRRSLYERLAISRKVMDEVIATLIDAGHAIEVKPRGTTGGSSVLLSTATTRAKELAKHNQYLTVAARPTPDDAADD